MIKLDLWAVSNVLGHYLITKQSPQEQKPLPSVRRNEKKKKRKCHWCLALHHSVAAVQTILHLNIC